jgi:cob(I)alamin adenosyltransferase
MSQDNYKKTMQRKKAHIEKKISEANIDKGVIVLLTGNGKGKSTSAFGMICRALGYDMKVGMVKFLKGDQPSGEDHFLSQHKNINIKHMRSGFTWDSQDKTHDIEKAKEAWEYALNFLVDPNINLVVLDELTYMLSYEYLPEEEVLKAISNRPAQQHIVITGRNAKQSLIDIADTVSDVKEIKHAFNQQIKAQKGIDY